LIFKRWRFLGSIICVERNRLAVVAFGSLILNRNDVVILEMLLH
jgi:hypothetical protein